nr:MAG TPA: hypothetical protein [Caudoviricetes sp.]
MRRSTSLTFSRLRPCQTRRGRHLSPISPNRSRPTLPSRLARHRTPAPAVSAMRDSPVSLRL